MHYCHDCAAKRGWMPRIPTDLVQNRYQLDKYIKHTVPSSSAGKTGVYTWPGSDTYKDFTVSAVVSGHVEIDARGRLNIVWVASAHTGLTWQGGQVVGSTDAVKVICHQDSSTLHSYPIATTELTADTCADCGRCVPY